MADASDRPPFLRTWRRIYLVALLNLAFWIALLAIFTRLYEPAA
jgi:hypothetical protein